MNFIAYQIAALFYTILLLFIYFSKKRVKNFDNKLYSLLIIINLVGVILDIVSTVMSYCNFNNIVLNLTSKMYLIYIVSWVLIFTVYIFVVSNEGMENQITKKHSNLFLTTHIFLSILILVLPLHNFCNGDQIYTYGESVMTTYIICGCCSLIWIFSLIKNRKNLKNKKYIPLWSFAIVGLLAGISQFIFPNMLIITFVLVFITVIMYHTIENPDVQMIQQLEVARDAADKANAAKTDFLSSMSHEIRTPLNAIVGFSDCIKHSDSLSEAKENADDIINASNTLLEIVNGILDISKIEAGKLEIVNSDYNAYQLFSGLAKLVTPKMKEKGLDFQVTIAEDLPGVLYGDSANLKKVVTNLLSNAYKYTDKGYVHYDVKCVNNNGVCRLIITVEDSGRGIKKENVDKLFNKFQRVDEDRNTTIEGTGLGLAITKQLVEMMGGTVVVHTVFGEGSKFTITLDQRIDNVQVEEIDKKEIALDTIDLTNKRILIVDDNPLNLKVATKLLERYNATVICANSGFECISNITNGEKYDLILMDDMMPKMSGTETFKKLKESSSFNIPVIALTANAISGMKERYLEEGFDDYLAKPIEKEAMIVAFHKIFDNDGLVESKAIKKEAVEEINNNTDFLDANGIDVKHGLELLGDMSLYNDTMNDFVNEIDKRLPLLEEYKNNSDMPNYAIIVHAIKSDCKYLGIMTLADMAYEHELKSKANDVEFVNANYENLINTIRDYVTICKHYLDRD